MISREIDNFLDRLYDFNKTLGGYEFKKDNRGTTEDMFIEYYQEFKR